MCGRFGLAGIEAAFPDICEAALVYLNEKALCQEPETKEDESETVGQDDVVLNAVADLVAAVTLFRTFLFTSLAEQYAICPLSP